MNRANLVVSLTPAWEVNQWPAVAAIANLNKAVSNQPKNNEKGNYMARTNGKNQTFSIGAPGAMSVLLAGDFTHWREQAIPMQRQRGSVWKTTVELAPGTYHYRFIVDGEWRDDPNCTLRVPNPYGGENAVRQVVQSVGTADHRKKGQPGRASDC